MAFHTVWSVDLGKSALKAVKLRREKNNVEILAIDKVDYPVGQNGVDSAASARKEAISVFRARNEVKEPVVVSHPGQGTFSRFIKVPAFDQKKVEDMVRYEASQQIPFPLDEVIWDFHVIDRKYLPGEEREVGLFAVRREAIDDFLLDFNQEGLSVEMLSIGYLALLNFIKYDLDPQEPSIVLDIGAAHTDLILIDAERFWIRPLPHSGQDITKAIMDRFKLKYGEAEKLKTEATRAPQQAAKIFQAVIQPKLKELVQEVHRSLGYYRSQAGDVKFQKLYLLGNGSRIVGIKKYLEEQLGVQVERVQSIQHLRINRDVNVKLLQTELSAFGTALGGGLQALGVGTCRVDLVPREEKLKKETERKKKHVFIAAGIVLLMIIASHFLISQKTGQVQTSVDQARQLQRKQIEPYKNKVQELKKATGVSLAMKKEALLRIGEVRKGALQSLRLIESVLASIPNDTVVEVKVSADEQNAAKQQVDGAREKLKDKLWIPWMEVKLVQWPEGKETQRKPAGSAAGAPKPKPGAKPEAETVPGYKTTVFAVVQMRATEAESNDVIKQKCQEPLRQALQGESATVVKEVQLGLAKPNLSAIYFDPGREVSATVEEEGRPFYGVPVFWFMVPRAPANPTPPEGKPEE